MTQRQQKFLLDRLSELRQTKPNKYSRVDLPEPEPVKRARKQIDAAREVIDKHEKKVRDATDKRNDEIMVAAGKIKQVILFGEAKDAIKMLDDFQKKVF